jgi:hypothetical protein
MILIQTTEIIEIGFALTLTMLIALIVKEIISEKPEYKNIIVNLKNLLMYVLFPITFLARVINLEANSFDFLILILWIVFIVLDRTGDHDNKFKMSNL